MKTPSPKVGEKKKNQCTRPQDDSPIRAIACLNKIDDMRRFEETEDCFILGFDPFDIVPLSFDSSAPHHHADDLSVIAEKGQVACRDFPHSRHLCLEFPFKKTPHESYCKMCYCYVCDTAAPCKDWDCHCKAEGGDFWKNQRNLKKYSPATVPVPSYNSQP
ncbi:hypothetical protein VNO78_01856 [Psophocarpus tetragonolobus]|uniref:Uncharacterized protein n=1 Tax=Psophocarpus tetragonolobus TaxID=3891 RepID=A0AAN9XUU3_PSOTE